MKPLERRIARGVAPAAEDLVEKVTTPAAPPAPVPPSPEEAEAAAIRAAQERLERARLEAATRPVGPPPVPPSTTRPALTPAGNLGPAIGQAVSSYRAALDRRSPEWEAERARLARIDRERRLRELRRVATQRGIPDHPGIMAVIVAERPLPTAAWSAVVEAFAWRQRATRPGFGAPPLTLVLAGGPGVGKSAALARAVATARAGLYVSARDVATLPESGWSEHAAARQALVTARVLAIDEAGMEEASRAGARMEAILAERVNRALATLVSTNLGLEEFVARYMTPRLSSRLSEEQGGRGQTWWVDCDGMDLRSPAALVEAGWTE